jgi:AhpD family alkylhydroperoxidase
MFLLEGVNELYDHFSDKVYAPGFLDKKTKEVIAVACSVMADCPGCIEWHYQAAVNAGSKEAELSEALAIAMAICSGSKRAKYGSIISKLEQVKK